MAISDLVPWKWGEKKVPVKHEEHNGDPIHALQRNMNQLFDNFFSGFGLAPFGGFGEQLGTFNPRIDLTETDDEIKVSAELPGLDENDLEVSLARNALTIRGEKKEEKEDKGENYYHMERSYGSFQRTIPLPTEVEPDQVDATFKKGVLTVTLPKTAEARQHSKKIAIKSA